MRGNPITEDLALWVEMQRMKLFARFSEDISSSFRSAPDYRLSSQSERPATGSVRKLLHNKVIYIPPLPPVPHGSKLHTATVDHTAAVKM